MAMQTGKGKLMAKYGTALDTAVRKHGGDPTEMGRVQLPPGIVNGVAKLVKCGFDQYKTGANQGEYYFRAEGVIVTPEEMEVNGTMMPVRGLRTSIIEAVCNTTTQAQKTTTVEEHVSNILNSMRMLGADTNGCGGEDLERVAADLAEAGPYFRFDTSVRKALRAGDADGVWENWRGYVKDYVPPDDADAVTDDTGAAEEPEPEPAKPAPRQHSAAAASKAAAKAPPKPANPPAEPTVAELVAEASGPDGPESDAARAALGRMAEAAGVAKEADAAPSWADVGDLIDAARKPKPDPKAAGAGKGKKAKEPEPGPEPEATWFAVGDVLEYTQYDVKTGRPLTDPKTKKPRKPIEVEVTAAYENGTYDVKSLDDGSEYTDVPDDHLTDRSADPLPY
ncbi:MAG: hypothetical protein ACRC7O_06185 [Fimbriiglobus sp.]